MRVIYPSQARVADAAKADIQKTADRHANTLGSTCVHVHEHVHVHATPHAAVEQADSQSHTTPTSKAFWKLPLCMQKRKSSGCTQVEGPAHAVPLRQPISHTWLGAQGTTRLTRGLPHCKHNKDRRTTHKPRPRHSRIWRQRCLFGCVGSQQQSAKRFECLSSWCPTDLSCTNTHTKTHTNTRSCQMQSTHTHK